MTLFPPLPCPMEQSGTFIDVHTHAGLSGDGIRILCLDAGTIDPANLTGHGVRAPMDHGAFDLGGLPHPIPLPEGEGDNVSLRASLESVEFLSVGIHPWTLDKVDRVDALKRIRELASWRTVLAVGECGLDRLARAPLALQEEVFRQQIAIAEQVGKPLITHCVRAHNELIRIWRSVRPKIPFIIHGYDNNAAIAWQLLKCGFYLSFGKALLKPASNAVKVIGQCPADKLFLETDDSGLPIETIYESAAMLRNVSMEELKATIMANFAAAFG